MTFVIYMARSVIDVIICTVYSFMTHFLFLSSGTNPSSIAASPVAPAPSITAPLPHSTYTVVTHFLVHLSRRLKCTIVIMRCPSSVVRRPSLTFHIFDFFSETAEWNSTKLDRKQDLNVLYQVCVFRADRKNKMAALASDWLRHFRLLL